MKIKVNNYKKVNINKIKKTTLILVILLSSFTINAQISQKYNSLYERTEFYDNRGNLIGYAKVNSLYDRIEYYDARGNMIKYEKQNELFDRKETFDSNGNKQGYEKKNKLFDRTEK